MTLAKQLVRRMVRVCTRDVAFVVVAMIVVGAAIVRPWTGHVGMCHSHGHGGEYTHVNGVCESATGDLGAVGFERGGNDVLVGEHECDAHSHLCDHTLMVRQGRAVLMLVGRAVALPAVFVVPVRERPAMNWCGEYAAGKPWHLDGLSGCARIVATSRALVM